jgi:pectate lyase
MRLNSVVPLLSTLASVASASPLGALGLASWDVEGFAKDNPVGGTTVGGKGGPTVTVTTPAEFSAAVAGNDPKIVLVKGEFNFTAGRPKIGSNKSVIGVGSTAHITGKGLDVVNSTNVILQNLRVSHIVDNDGVTIRNSTRVWIDHNEFHSTIDKGPDFYVRIPH